MSVQRSKGTRAETAVLGWLRDELGVDTLHRAPLRGNKDVGDIIGLPAVVVEVKNTKLPEPVQWAKELCREINNAGARDGVVLWSPPGVGMGRVDQWVAFELSSRGSRTVPHIGPLNRLHRYVVAMCNEGFVTRVEAGSECLEARLAWRWLVEYRERFGHLLERSA